MSVKRHLCRSGRNVRPFPDYAWISDDVLDAAIQRFSWVTLSKRDVSFAPGPLEARKRENKRRLAHISHTNNSGPGYIDLSLLSSLNERAQEGEWRWQAPGTVEQSNHIPLSSWLTDLIHRRTPPEVPASRQDGGAAEPQSRVDHQEIKYKLQEHAFLSRLDHFRSLDELRGLASLFEIDVRKHSQKAFRRLYESEKSLATCLEFLEDTSMDDPFARNLEYLLSELSQRLQSHGNMDSAHIKSMVRGIMTPWLKLQLFLGKRSITDIVGLGIFIHDMARNETDEVLRQEFATAVLEGLRSSTVRSFKDITPATRGFLLKSVMKGELTDELQDLGLSLAETVRNPALVSRFLSESIRSRPALHGVKEVGTWQQDIFPRISMLLQAQSQEAVKSIVRITSKFLIKWQANVPQDSIDIDIRARLVDRWWSTVATSILPNFNQSGLESLRIEQTIPSDQPSILALYANHLGTRKKARFVFRNWFSSRLPSHDFEKLSNDLRQNLERESNDSSFLCMLRTVHGNGRLEDDFIRHVFRILDRMRLYGLIAEILKRTRDSDIHIPLNVVLETIQHLLTTSPQQAHRIFRCDPRIPLESFPILAEKMIENPNFHPNMVWHHQRTRPWQSGGDDFNRSPEFQRKGRTRLLSTIALAFSKASHVNSRMARRQVMKCVRRWQNEGLGPFSHHISRALTRAGIIRPLQEKEWVSTALVTFILALVRQVEGPARADEIDHILHTWHHRLQTKNKPRCDLEKQLFREQGPLKNFFFWRKWSSTHRRYDLVILRDRRRRLRYPDESPTYPSKTCQGAWEENKLSGSVSESKGDPVMTPTDVGDMNTSTTT